MVNTILEMPIRPEAGEVLLYLALHRIENITPTEALKLGESLGFNPQLRYRTWEKDGVQQVGIYALLHYEKRDFDSALEPDYLENQLEALFTQIVPSTAVNFAYCLKRGRTVNNDTEPLMTQGIQQ